MKKILIITVILGLSLATFAQENHANHTVPIADSTAKKPKSPRMSAMAMVGDNHIHLDYGSPSVRGRSVWGGLVAYNEVWCTGAHKATSISFSKDVIINGTKISQGKYGLFTIQGEKESTFIINKMWDMHLADNYNEKEDMVRINVKNQKTEKLIEALAFEVKDLKNGMSQVSMLWENRLLSFEVKNQ